LGVRGTEPATDRNKIVGGELIGAAGRRGGLRFLFPRFEYCWLSFSPLIFQSFSYTITSPIKSPFAKGGRGDFGDSVGLSPGREKIYPALKMKWKGN